MFFSSWPWWAFILTALVATHLTIISVTVYLHRHQAHRALELAAPVAHFFRFWLWLTTGMVTREWVAVHRKHHAKCETEEDPHSPQVHGVWTVLFKGAFLYRREAQNAATLELYGRNTPDDWLERHVYTSCNFYGIFILLAVELVLFGLFAGFSIWLVQMVWIPFWAAGVVNGVAHYWGYRNFETRDASTNLVPWGVIIGGEELHNNHHAFAGSARLSYNWYEFDLGWLYIRILQALGLARVKKISSRPRLGPLRDVVDSATVQAMLGNRHDIHTRYAKSLKRIYCKEIQLLKGQVAFRSLKRWIGLERKDLPHEWRIKLNGLLVQCPSLQTAYTMRDELTALWGRSGAGCDQVVKQLQEWCRKAETSGIEQLEQLSRRLRSYSITPYKVS